MFAEWKVIRDRLDSVHSSKIIDRYEQYRDILYGNKQAVGKEFVSFSVVGNEPLPEHSTKHTECIPNSRL